MLTVEGVELQLGERRWNYSIELETQGVYALLGRSGSGKSTLLNLIAGFLQPDAGAIKWQGDAIHSLEPAQRPITTLFQDHNLFSHLSVFKNIGLGVSPKLTLSLAQKDNISSVLDSVGLSGYENKLPGSLSGGEKQRVALARCILRRQPILLLDEPFSALDATTRKEMITLLNSLIQEFKPCVVMVTHDPDDAVAMGATQLSMKSDRVEFA